MDPSRIVGTAEWYYKRWPKFYNEECFQILADFTAHPEKYLQEDDGVEEKKDSDEETKTTIRRIIRIERESVCLWL